MREIWRSIRRRFEKPHPFDFDTQLAVILLQKEGDDEEEAVQALIKEQINQILSCQSEPILFFQEIEKLSQTLKFFLRMRKENHQSKQLIQAAKLFVEEAARLMRRRDVSSTQEGEKENRFGIITDETQAVQHPGSQLDIDEKVLQLLGVVQRSLEE